VRLSVPGSDGAASVIDSVRDLVTEPDDAPEDRAAPAPAVAAPVVDRPSVVDMLGLV
jgi:cell pole-organizing protein PopZ